MPLKSPFDQTLPNTLCPPQELALAAVQTVTVDVGPGHKEIDIKNYAKVEKVPGGTIEDCRVLKGAWRGTASRLIVSCYQQHVRALPQALSSLSQHIPLPPLSGLPLPVSFTGRSNRG